MTFILDYLPFSTVFGLKRTVKIMILSRYHFKLGVLIVYHRDTLVPKRTSPLPQGRLGTMGSGGKSLDGSRRPENDNGTVTVTGQNHNFHCINYQDSSLEYFFLCSIFCCCLRWHF